MKASMFWILTISLLAVVHPSSAIDIHRAALQGNLDQIKSIVAEKPHLVNAEDSDGTTPLYLAACYGRTQIVRFLLKHGATISQQHPNAWSLLEEVEAAGYLDVYDLLQAFAVSQNSGRGTGPQRSLDDFSRAMLLGDMQKLQTLLSENPHLTNAQDQLRKPPIHEAVVLGDTEIVQLLIKNGADINAANRSDSAGVTPLHSAITLGLDEVAELLLKHGGSIETDMDWIMSRNNMGSSNLTERIYEAVVEDDVDWLKSLLAKLSKRPARGLFQWRWRKAYYWSIQRGQTAMVEAFLKDGTMLVGSPGAGESGPLHWAARVGHKDIAELLIANGADINARGAFYKRPLHLAAIYGHCEVAELLIKNKAEIDARDGHRNRTPLHEAAEGGHRKVVELLLRSGADIEAKTRQGETALHLAARMGHKGAVEALLIAGADVDSIWQCNKTTRMGERGWTTTVVHYTPLDLAARWGNIDVVKLLLENGASIRDAAQRAAERGQREILQLLATSGTDKTEEPIADQQVGMHSSSAKTTDVDARSNGFTALHTSAHKGNAEIVEDLIRLGADVNARVASYEYLGQTALHLAVEAGHENVVEVLAASGANINARDWRGITPLALAVNQGESRKSVADILLKHGGLLNMDFHDAVIQGDVERIKTMLASNRTLLNVQNGLALKLAQQWGHKNVVELLLAAGAATNVEPEKNDLPPKPETLPLHGAVAGGKIEVVRNLISEGADVNARTPMQTGGATALHVAARENNAAIARILIDNGAEINAIDADGRTPLNLVRDHEGELAELLRNHGAVKEKVEIHNAVRRGQLAEIKSILEKIPKAVNAQDRSGDTPLLVAAQHNNWEVARFLTEAGASVNAQNSNGMTALYFAVWQNNKEIVHFFISSGADVNTRLGRDGGTALHWAVHQGHKDTVQLLIERGADVNLQDDEKRTALHYAAKAGQKEVAELLLDAGAAVDAKDCEGWTALYYAETYHREELATLLRNQGGSVGAHIFDAIAERDTEKVKILVADQPELIAFTNEGGSSPLHLAAEVGDKEIVQFLLSKGANPDCKDNRGWTPLHSAVMKNHKHIIEILLTNGAKVNARTYAVPEMMRFGAMPGKVASGFTPLHFAIWIGDKDGIEVLIKYGANVNVKTYVAGFNSNTPLHLAADRSQKDVIELLLENGADVNAVNDNGQTPLHIVPLFPEANDAIILLLDKGADVDAKDDMGMTPLLQAAQSRRKDIVALYLARGASVNILDNFGQTALHIAAESGLADLAALLLDNGAAVNAQTFVDRMINAGSTPLHITVQRKNKVLIELLLARQADPTIKNNMGQTPLDLATRWGSKDIVELLGNHRSTDLGKQQPVTPIKPKPKRDSVGESKPQVEIGTFTVNVTSTDGSVGAITLRQEGSGYVGPRGEFYQNLPTEEELKKVYGH